MIQLINLSQKYLLLEVEPKIPVSELVVRYVSSNYHHNSAKCDKSVKRGTTNKQYFTVKNKSRP